MKVALIRTLVAVELIAGAMAAAIMGRGEIPAAARPTHPVTHSADAPAATVVNASVSVAVAPAVPVQAGPVQAMPLPTRTGGPAVPKAATCAPTQLRAVQQDVKVALGAAVATYVVQETAGRACSLSSTQPAWVTPMVGPAAVKALTVQSANGAPGQPTLAPRSKAVVRLTLQNAVSSVASSLSKSAAAVSKSVSGVASSASRTSPAPSASPSAQPFPSAQPPAIGPAGLPPIEQLLKQLGGAVQSLLPPTTATAAPPTPAPIPAPPPPPNQTTYPAGAAGFDISWPQCGGAYPLGHTVAIVGVNDGKAFTTNPCLKSEADWAGPGMELYINLNSPKVVNATDQAGPAGNCGAGDNSCLAYNYGYNHATQSAGNAAAQGVQAKTWWIDVETVGQCTGQFPTNSTGYWSCDQGLNSRTIQGAVDGLRATGHVAGVYSTGYQWGVITGGYVSAGPPIPNWLAGAEPTAAWCSGSHNFGGGRAWLLQLYPPDPFDRDQAC